MTKMINGIDYSSIGINQNLDVNLSSRASESTLSNINDKIHTINQYPDGTITTGSRSYLKIINGDGYTVSERFEAVDSNGVVNICIANPTGSGKSLKLLLLETYSTGELYLDIFKNGNITTAGTALTINNLNLGSTNTSLATVEYGGTYTFTNQFLKMTIPGGSCMFTCGGAGENTKIIIPEGKNILLKITNKSASSENISFRMNWIED